MATSPPAPRSEPARAGRTGRTPADAGGPRDPEEPLLRRWDQSGIPLLVARLILGAMFIMMGWSKASEPVQFLKLINTYHLVPEGMPWLLNGMAVLLPWIEIVCGTLLLLGIGVRGASLLLLVMLIVFTGAVLMRAVGIHQAGSIPFCSIKFDCGCGTGEQYICRKVPENIGLMLLSLVALFSRSNRFCLWRNLMPGDRLPWRMEGY